MGDRVVKLQARHYFETIITTGNQDTSTPVTECHSLTPPSASSPDGTEIGVQANPPLRIDEPTTTRPSPHDPEKESFERHSHQTHGGPYSHSRDTYTGPEDSGHDSGPKEHAIWIMIYLSALSPLLTPPIALYSLLLSTTLLLLFPLCFCLNQLSICARFRHLLSPLLVFQLELIYSSYDMSDLVQSETSDVMVLVLVSILSPLYAMAIAVATWVAGVFWFYTAILGNPDGREDRDDGRESILAVRGWWESWLIRSLETRNHLTFGDDGSERGL